MKQSLLYANVVLAACAGFMANEALAKPWWSNPVRKYSEDTDSPAASDAHYMNKDESDQYLLIGLTANANNRPVLLYSIPALISATSSNDVVPLVLGTSTNLYNVWKGGAVSDDLKLALTGQASVGPHNSMSLTGPWVKGVNVFSITNDPTAFSMDGIDFSHTSEYLFSNIYTTGYQNRIAKWDVVDLLHGGIGLTTNTLFTTSLTRIRNVSSYYIGGKDLVYYAEGAASSATECKVCVYDPSAPAGQQETVLVTGLPVGTIACDIMNVKVSGVGLGQMYLYVQSEKDSLYVYELNAGGKSVGKRVKTFTATEINALMGGENYDRIRNFEVTNDGRFAFFVPAPLTGTAKIRVLWAQPVVETAWWQAPILKCKENASLSTPRGMNMDESGQYLFLPSGISSSSSGYLYSIPALTAAATSNDVEPIASGKPAATFQPGTIIYQQDFDGIEAADTTAVTNALGWEICELFMKHTARYAISNGTLYVDNLDIAGLTSTDSYVVVKSSDYMKPFCTNDYSYQYDVTYRAASGSTAADSGSRYVSLLCNYTGTNVYNTMDLRYGGNGYNQFRYKIPGEWNHYSTDIWPIEATGTNSMLYLLYGQAYNSSVTDGLKDRKCTVRVEMSMANGPSVYVNGLQVSKTDLLLPYWNQTKNFAYAICLKPSRDIKCEIDNIMVWQGCGTEPVWKGGAISDQNMRILTASSGKANSSLPMIGAWTNAAAVVSITNDPAMVTAYMDAMDFGHNFGSTQFLYSYSDYFTRTNNITAQPGYQHKLYKWNVTNLTSNGMGFTSNAVYQTVLTQLRNLDAYYIGGKDLVYYGEGQVGLAGATRVCVLDTSTGTETNLINATTNAMPSNIMNVKVAGVGLGQMHLYVQCDSGALYVYDLNADGLSVTGAPVKTFTPAQIKTLLGGVSFTNMRSFEVTNDERFAFFTYNNADGLYVVGTRPQGLGTVLRAH